MARCVERSGAQPADRRHAARRAGPRGRQQHARRVGLHQHLRRLERRRPARDGPVEAEPVPDAGRLARVRASRRSDRRSRASQRSATRCCGPSGVRCSGRTTADACARIAGWRIPPSASPRRSRPSSVRERSRRRLTWSTASGHRGRISSSPIEAAGLDGASTARSRAGRGSTGGCLRRGAMDRAAGPAGWRMWSIRA